MYAGESGLEIELIRGRLGPGQQLLLCSDGLVDELVDGEIAQLLAATDNPKQQLESLIQGGC